MSAFKYPNKNRNIITIKTTPTIPNIQRPSRTENCSTAFLLPLDGQWLCMRMVDQGSRSRDQERLRMSHTIKNKQKLILRSKRIRGQFEALERVLDEGRDCSEVLQIISAARGAVNSLMTELLEGHIRHHVLDPKRKPNSEQTHAADEVIDMVKTYLR